jgi:hypothetical protein
MASPGASTWWKTERGATDDTTAACPLTYRALETGSISTAQRGVGWHVRRVSHHACIPCDKLLCVLFEKDTD